MVKYAMYRNAEGNISVGTIIDSSQPFNVKIKPNYPSNAEVVTVSNIIRTADEFATRFPYCTITIIDGVECDSRLYAAKVGLYYSKKGKLIPEDKVVVDKEGYFMNINDCWQDEINNLWFDNDTPKTTVVACENGKFRFATCNIDYACYAHRVNFYRDNDYDYFSDYNTEAVRKAVAEFLGSLDRNGEAMLNSMSGYMGVKIYNIGENGVEMTLEEDGNETRQIFHFANDPEMKHCDVCDTNYHVKSKVSVAYEDSIREYINPDFKFNTKCPCCAKSSLPRTQVRSYSYKPIPVFFGLGKHYGVELELCHSNEPELAVTAINMMDSQPYYCKHDGSLDWGGVEIVSHPMTLAEHEDKAVEMLDRACAFGLESDTSCGMHIHVSRDEYDDDVEDKVYVLLARLGLENVFYLSNREETDQMDEWAGLNYVSLEQKKDKSYEVIVEGRSDRYHAFNTTNMNTYEFRIFNSTTNYSEYIGNIKTVEAIMSYCDNHSLEDCITACMEDVFGYSCDEEVELEVELYGPKLYKWTFTCGQYLYLEKIDKERRMFTHYHVFGYDEECHFRLPMSGKFVGYDDEDGYIGVSDSVTEKLDVCEDFYEDCIAHNKDVLDYFANIEHLEDDE